MTPLEQLEQDISRVTNGEYVQFILPIVERYAEGRVREELTWCLNINYPTSPKWRIAVKARLAALTPPSPKEPSSNPTSGA